MENGSATATAEIAISGITKEDALKSIEVIKKALNLRPFIREGIFREKWMELSEAQRMEEFLTPRISIFFPDEDKNIPSIFLRITGDEGPLVEAFFYPIEAAWSFLDEARQYLANMRLEGWTEEQVEERSEFFAVEMMLMMIDNLYSRSNLMLGSFTMETIAQWHANQNDDMHGYYAAKGVSSRKPKKAYVDNTLKIYSREVKQLWKYHGQTAENGRKLQFVDEYEDVLKHWKRLCKMISDDDRDWQQYAKAGNFGDTPDDLLKKLSDVNRSSDATTANRVSELALEHAARRAELIKKSGISEWAQQKRKEGLLVSDYSGAQLFTFLKEGKEMQQRVKEYKKIQDRISTYPVPDSLPDPAMEKKQKSLEQKLEFVKENSKKSVEPKRDSAMEKKS